MTAYLNLLYGGLILVCLALAIGTPVFCGMKWGWVGGVIGGVVGVAAAVVTFVLVGLLLVLASDSVGTK